MRLSLLCMLAARALSCFVLVIAMFGAPCQRHPRIVFCSFTEPFGVLTVLSIATQQGRTYTPRLREAARYSRKIVERMPRSGREQGSWEWERMGHTLH
jgi:hypothetical protein